MVSIPGFHPGDWSSILHGAIMVYLKVYYKIWVIDYETFKGKGNSFTLDFGPFSSEQQARWFWLTMKENMKTNYDIAIIYDEHGNELYIDESKKVQPF